MRECKILHIHDANPISMRNENKHLLEYYPWAEKTINDLLDQDYEVKQIIPQFVPDVPEEGGFIVYLEREIE